MSKEEEKNVVAAIGRLSQEYNYSNEEDVKAILDKIGNNKLFQQSPFGMRYINRLSVLGSGMAPSSCILCGKHAENQVICNICMNTIGQYVGKMQKQPTVPKKTEKKNTNSEDITASIEDLFKDMDDSLMQLASQSTVGSIKKLMLINITLSIINSIVIFFLALFLWKFIMSQ